MARKAQVKVIIQIGGSRWTWWDEADMTTPLIDESSGGVHWEAERRLLSSLRQAVAYRDGEFHAKETEAP